MDVPTELPFSFITFAASAIISARARPVGGGGMGWGGIDIFPDVMDGLGLDSQFAQVATYVCPTRGRASEK